MIFGFQIKFQSGLHFELPHLTSMPAPVARQLAQPC